MTLLHPIAVVDQVIEEYRSYLRTEFRARDPQLRKALEDALDRSRFLAQEPFFQVYRPFKPAERWQDLGLDPKLAKVMERRSGSATAYLHQSEAIAHLLQPEADPLAVTTGTGSGKTECFLLPVIQNAIDDATDIKHPGLTALLVYPMNALANDQEQRIADYLEESGHTYVRVARYDRSTSEQQRAELRARPPHILLTNYMMLEYLLVRPADREALFKNHRCRFIVLDEVHTYRGTLGANIALLYRRLVAHLAHAAHDIRVENRADHRRFPKLVPVATSATIKSIDEAGRAKEEVTRLRREAVQEFIHTLTGEERTRIRVIGEERIKITPPADARWPAAPVVMDAPALDDVDAVRKAVAALAGLPASTPVAEAAPKAAIFWTLGELLGRQPRSVTDIVEHICSDVPERRAADRDATRKEVTLALAVGAGLDDVPSALRLRVHRFIRGGWRFHRCVDPECGRLYPMGEGSCSCGKPTAPLLICRSCGADALHFAGGTEEPEDLKPGSPAPGEQEWVLYDSRRQKIAWDDEEDDEPALENTRARRGKKAATELKGKPVEEGSFDPGTCFFTRDSKAFAFQVALAPARNRCLVCGGTAGARSILTPVALGTSAALRVLAEGVVEGLAREHARARDAASPASSGKFPKERLLIFADSRQDAAHQARFITYAGRYDRMRRRVVRALEAAGRPLTIEEVLRALLTEGLLCNDNRHVEGKRGAGVDYLPRALQERALLWEEAPLLDDLAVTAGYRGTLLNLGLVGVRYGKLAALVEGNGQALAASLGLTRPQIVYLCRCLLDEMRSRGALSRPLLRYHPANPSCTDDLRVHVEWERRFKKPQGYPCTEQGAPLGSLDPSEVPDGVSVTNAWRRTNRGRPPRLQRVFEQLVGRMTRGRAVREDDLLSVFGLLRDGRLLEAAKLFGFKKTRELLQVNADAVELELIAPVDRRRCNVCSVRAPWAEVGAPCRACHGLMEIWPEKEIEANRYVHRIRSSNLMPLRAGEHTAQITGDARIELEERFKSDDDPLNVIACSPTLEMGIDVGGLDAVLMRNVPPRPDNYAQRGGRAGRRTRVGVVIGYARSTPHDQYFYDKPAEMIAGEVAAPAVGLGNRDVVIRHLNAIAFGAAAPGLAGRMAEYVTLKGELREEPVGKLLEALEAKFDDAASLALQAWGLEVLGPAGLETKEKLLAALAEQPARVRDVFDRVRHQLIELQERVKQWSELGLGQWPAINAMQLSRRLLGLPADERDKRAEADDRSGGHPMRRFAEFGLLPGYEFPSEPATLRLLHDDDEDEPISVARRFGLAQYQPEALAHARGHRWRVAGLDTASPWNPRTEEPQWIYRLCGGCGLRFDAQGPVRCPRCRSTQGSGVPLPGYEFGGFIAVRNDTPVLEEEDRIARTGLLQCHPQWSGDVVARHELTMGWRLELRRAEEIRWLNECRPPRGELEHACSLHPGARGFYLCPACGWILNPPAVEAETKTKGRKKPRRSSSDDTFGHARGCRLAGQPPRPLAITTSSRATTLRLLVNLPAGFDAEDYRRWGLTLGYSLRTGIRQLYMLEGSELEFELEGPWSVRAKADDKRCQQGSLTFIDPAVGGSGFLDRAAEDLHLVAGRAITHLDHPDCDSACYRCLKSYQNQRFHALLSWPHIMPALEMIAARKPREVPLKVQDKFNAKPWIEAYEAGVGSPLELKFLRLLEKKGIEVKKQVPIAVEDGKKPITIADFALPDRRIAIYVDGAAFHTGDNLRRDRHIRGRLRSANPPWHVIELTAKDLATGLEPLSALFGSFPHVPDPEPVYELEDDSLPPPKPSSEMALPSSPGGAPDRFPGYTILDELAGGAMARCFRARHADSGEIVFLKSVRVGSQDEAALQRELDIYGRLQYRECEHVLQVRDIVRSSGLVTLVTEFADGGDLKHFMDERGPKGKGVPASQGLPIALEVAAGLGELHGASIVHRDLKPENVLRAGAKWKLADFGIAKNRAIAAPGVTFQQAGTYGYAAAEQLEGAPADPSADVYSFGKLLTYLLTGATDPDRIPVELSNLRKLVQRCVQYVPESRPTIGEVSEALRQMLGGG